MSTFLFMLISNMHADAVGGCLINLTPPRAWRIVARSGDHVEDAALCESDASRHEVQTAMDSSVEVRGDGCSAINWLTQGEAGELAGLWLGETR